MRSRFWSGVAYFASFWQITWWVDRLCRLGRFPKRNTNIYHDITFNTGHLDTHRTNLKKSKPDKSSSWINSSRRSSSFDLALFGYASRALSNKYSLYSVLIVFLALLFFLLLLRRWSTIIIGAFYGLDVVEAAFKIWQALFRALQVCLVFSLLVIAKFICNRLLVRCFLSLYFISMQR